jgi:GTP-binding protein EngB required for normal cell division
MSLLSDRHRSRLATAFAEIDAALVEATHALDIDALRSPFSTRLADATPVQQRVIADYAEQLRTVMHSLLKRQQIAPPHPNASAVQAARNALDRAIVAAEELGPRYMCGYGSLSDELEGELNRIVSALLDRLDTMRGFLESKEADDLDARSTRPGPRQPAGALLRELARAIDRHRLSDLRPSLDALTERCERQDVEIAVFGRVNSGKSSLLNRFLGTQLLPVGAMPVTAVPVYVSYAAQAWGFANFADAASEKFALGRLPEFAAEHFNPSNLRHVTRLRVELPASQLQDGITLVDVPGIDFGGGAFSPADLLPRCDIGLVLIDAAAGLTLDEAAVVTALRRAGSSTIVLVTKADLLREDERWTVHGLVERGLAALTGNEVPVFLASATSPGTALGDDWIYRGLRPLLARREALRAASLERKLDQLREKVVSALERRWSLVVAPGSTPATFQEASAGLAEVRSLLDAASKPSDAQAEAARQTSALLDEVAHNAALLWPQSHERSLDVTTLLAASLEARANGQASTVEKELSGVCARCRLALAAAGSAVGIPRVEASELPARRPLTRIDGAQFVRTTVLRQPALAFLGRRWRERAARRWLAHSPVRVAIDDAMRRHFEVVDEWRLDAIAELRSRFVARSRYLQALHTAPARSGDHEPTPEAQAIAADLNALRQVDVTHPRQAQFLPRGYESERNVLEHSGNSP